MEAQLKKFDILIIIPARANSQRLPGKNMKLLGGIPLIAHSINYAQECGFENIVVTSNDIDVLAYAKNNQIKAIERPDVLAGNEEPVITALQHAIDQIKQEFKAIVLLQPTNPLRPKNLLAEAIEIFEKQNSDSLMTVSKLEKKLGKITSHQFEPYNYKMGQRSQDLEPLFFENGLLYVFKPTLLKNGKLIGDNNYAMVVDHPFAEIDIDSQEDFDKAELYLKHYFDE
ncbi:MAG: acylneuraminate cytidylyltransferase [Cytophagaceae bacterium]|nr:acylneuraminate cytidylyltransferase [Cytophagaceae bacterium]